MARQQSTTACPNECDYLLSPKNPSHEVLPMIETQCPIPGHEEKKNNLRLLQELIEGVMNGATEKLMAGVIAMYNKPATVSPFVPVSESGDNVSQYLRKCTAIMETEQVHSIPSVRSILYPGVSDHGNHVDEDTASTTSTNTTISSSGLSEDMESPHGQILHSTSSEDADEDVSTANGVDGPPPQEQMDYSHDNMESPPEVMESPQEEIFHSTRLDVDEEDGRETFSSARSEVDEEDVKTVNVAACPPPIPGQDPSRNLPSDTDRSTERLRSADGIVYSGNQGDEDTASSSSSNSSSTSTSSSGLSQDMESLHVVMEAPQEEIVHSVDWEDDEEDVSTANVVGGPRPTHGQDPSRNLPSDTDRNTECIPSVDGIVYSGLSDHGNQVHDDTASSGSTSGSNNSGSNNSGSNNSGSNNNDSTSGSNISDTTSGSTSGSINSGSNNSGSNNSGSNNSGSNNSGSNNSGSNNSDSTSGSNISDSTSGSNISDSTSGSHNTGSNSSNSSSTSTSSSGLSDDMEPPHELMASPQEQMDSSHDNMESPPEVMESPQEEIFHSTRWDVEEEDGRETFSSARSEVDEEDVKTVNVAACPPLQDPSRNFPSDSDGNTEGKMEAKEDSTSGATVQDNAPTSGGDDSLAEGAFGTSTALPNLGDDLRMTLQKESVQAAKEKSLQADKAGGEQHPYFDLSKDSTDDADGDNSWDGSAYASNDRQVENRKVQLGEKETDEQAPPPTRQPQPQHKREKAALVKDKREQVDRFSSEAESAAGLENVPPLAEEAKTVLRMATKTSRLPLLNSTGTDAKSGQPPTRKLDRRSQAKCTPIPTAFRPIQTSRGVVSLYSSWKRRSITVNVSQPALPGVSWAEHVQHVWHNHLLPDTHPSPSNLVKRYMVQDKYLLPPAFDSTAPQDQDGQSKTMAILRRHQMDFCQCMPCAWLAWVCWSQGLLTWPEFEQVLSAANGGCYKANLVFLSFTKHWDSNRVMYLKNLLCSGAPPWVRVVFDTCIGVECELPHFHAEM